MLHGIHYAQSHLDQKTKLLYSTWIDPAFDFIKNREKIKFLEKLQMRTYSETLFSNEILEGTHMRLSKPSSSSSSNPSKFQRKIHKNDAAGNHLHLNEFWSLGLGFRSFRFMDGVCRPCHHPYDSLIIMSILYYNWHQNCYIVQFPQ